MPPSDATPLETDSVSAPAATVYSTYPDLQAEITRLKGQIPLTWVRSTQRIPFANFGDALGPVMVSALTGLPMAPRAFNSKFLRLATIGTIGQAQSNGTVHFWGTGIDAKRTLGEENGRFTTPPDTSYVIHALRGPKSRAAALANGLHAPPVYGDPGWLLPRLMPGEGIARTKELGVIPHISELAEPNVEGLMRAEMKRYLMGQGDPVKIISTYHEPSMAAFRAKLEDILSCKRVVSASFHGLILADAYGIPCALLSRNGRGAWVADTAADAEKLDHRVADFYLGAGRKSVLVYGQPIEERTDWSDVIRAIDSHYQPFSWSPDPLIESFPLKTLFDAHQARWPQREGFGDDLIW
ncbi:polysaccharide pyruvyl transferase family protein [Acetobacteraceae bacterium H6797]|nr:polysaccharide pyruvyl transferase family protein [Acetobacteraceae bacterium H6797]